MAAKDDVQIWLGIGSVVVGLIGIWYYLDQQQTAAIPAASTTTGTALPTLSAPSSAPITYDIGSSPIQALFPGITLPQPAPLSAGLNIAAQTMPDVSNPMTLLMIDPYGNSSSTPPWLQSSAGGTSLPSPDGGTTGGSCGCGCTDGSSPSYLGTTIENLLAQRALQKDAQSWSPIPSFSPYVNPNLSSPGFPLSWSSGGSSPPPSVPGYNNGNAITASG